MRGDTNLVVLSGRLGGPPEVRTTTGGTKVANFTVCTETVWERDGEVRKHQEWSRVVAWASLAEQAERDLRKGSPVTLIGELRTESYEKDGQKRYVTKVIAAQLFSSSGIEGSHDEPDGPVPF